MEDLTPHAMSAVLCGDVQLYCNRTKTLMLPATYMHFLLLLDNAVPGAMTIDYSSTCAFSLIIDIQWLSMSILYGRACLGQTVRHAVTPGSPPACAADDIMYIYTECRPSLIHSRDAMT